MTRPKGSSNYTAKQFINAMPGTGGIVRTLAEKVGCSWITARRYIDKFPTVKLAWQAERNQVTDKAEHNIITAIRDKDLQMSKWWLQVMRDEFTTKTKTDITTGGDKLSPLTDQQLEQFIAGVTERARARTDSTSS